jgi:hypothetical protein
VLNALLEDAAFRRLQILCAGNVVNIDEHATGPRGCEIRTQLNELIHARR